MRKKHSTFIFNSTVTTVVVFALALMLGCTCAWAGPEYAIEPKKPAHAECHGAQEKKSSDQNAKDCCGKCEFERAAVILRDSSSFKEAILLS